LIAGKGIIYLVIPMFSYLLINISIKIILAKILLSKFSWKKFLSILFDEKFFE